MCRLLGVVAREPGVLGDLLAEDLAPFLALACEHGDGWGTAWLTRRGTVESVKEPASAEGSELCARTVRTVTTDAALLHLRMASPQFPLVPGNTHPFGDDALAFAHNGFFWPGSCLDATIGAELLAGAEGGTDSERFHLAVRRRVDEGLHPAKAILAVADEIRTRADGFASLNCLLLTPEALFAFTAHDPESEVVGRRGPDFFAVGYRRTAESVVVASTGWPQPWPDWTTLPEGHVLEVRRHDLATVVHGG